MPGGVLNEGFRTLTRLGVIVGDEEAGCEPGLENRSRARILCDIRDETPVFLVRVPCESGVAPGVGEIDRDLRERKDLGDAGERCFGLPLLASSSGFETDREPLAFSGDSGSC